MEKNRTFEKKQTKVVQGANSDVEQNSVEKCCYRDMLHLEECGLWTGSFIVLFYSKPKCFQYNTAMSSHRFSRSVQGTLACRLESPGFELPTF